MCTSLRACPPRMRQRNKLVFGAVVTAAVLLFSVPVLRVEFVVYASLAGCRPSSFGEILMGCGYL